MTNDPTNDTADREAIVDALVGNVVYALRDTRLDRERLHSLAVAVDDLVAALDEIMADWPGSSTTSSPTGP